MPGSSAPLEINSNARNGLPYFNPSAFSLPPLGVPGTVSRRSFYGPGMNNWDIALLKTTQLTESSSLESRFETFNALNHAQFFGPNSVDGNINDSTFGQVVGATAPCVVQVAMKLHF